jgi:hypothetical protein
MPASESIEDPMSRVMNASTAALRVFFALAVLLAATPQSASAQGPEEQAVRAAVEHYLMAHATGDGAHHRMVFHPVANLFWVDDGALQTLPGEQYIARSPGRPAPDEAQRKRRIAMVDVTGDAAVAKVELDYPGALLTDYFALLKVEGEWKIVNKIFTRQARN